MSSTAFRWTGIGIIVIGLYTLFSWVAALSPSAAELPGLVAGLGAFLYKSLHFAGLYFPAYLLLSGFLLFRDKTKMVGLLSLGFVPVLFAGLALRLMFSVDFESSLLPGLLARMLTREGAVIVSAGFALIALLGLLQLPAAFRHRGGRVAYAGVGGGTPSGSSVRGQSSERRDPGGNPASRVASSELSAAAPAGSGEQDDLPDLDDERFTSKTVPADKIPAEEEESRPLEEVDGLREASFREEPGAPLESARNAAGELSAVEAFKSAVSGKLESRIRQRPPRFTDLDQPLKKGELKKLWEEENPEDLEDGVDATAAYPLGQPYQPRRPMFYGSEEPEENDAAFLEVYFSKEGGISDYPPKGKLSWTTGVEEPNELEEGSEEEKDRVPEFLAGKPARASVSSKPAFDDRPQEEEALELEELDSLAEPEDQAKTPGLPRYGKEYDFDADVEEVEIDLNPQEERSASEALSLGSSVSVGNYRNRSAHELDVSELPGAAFEDEDDEPSDAERFAASLRDDGNLEAEDFSDSDPEVDEDFRDGEESGVAGPEKQPLGGPSAPRQGLSEESHHDVDTDLLPPLPSPSEAKSWQRGVYRVPIEGILDQASNHEYWRIDAATTKSADILKDTLKEFGIEAEVTGIRKGPVITMFEILPAPGVKLARIVNLADNIALRLAAQSVRIVAPIPGKHAVGIEIPNKDRALVSFSELLQAEGFKSPKVEIPVALGKDITGEAQIVDLARTPHLLIAGSTGSGKSVSVNALICSILYRKSPAEVNMILIDPKIVELKFYNDIPHLLTPVITDPKKAFQALQWCLYEMERRYSLLDAMQVRDIKSYNKKIVARKIATPKLPYLVIVIDEFADLMATSGKELEGTLARLAAMSRAVGIHLVLATQRPSTDVITGLIKANIPSRIAFMVASKIDSRIIIDSMGAEKLLGKGDMLFTSAWDPFPFRMQGAFLSEEEVERVVSYVKTLGKPDYIDDEIFIEDDEDSDLNDGEYEDGDDPLMKEAIDIVVSAKKASASYLQRRLKIGYNRAARLVEQMEDMGIVGPQNGSKAREILRMYQ